MSQAYTQKVSIIVDNIIKGKGKLEEITRNYRALGEQFELASNSIIKNALKQEVAMRKVALQNKFLSEWSNKLNVNTSRVKQTMSAAGLTFDRSGRIVDLAGRKVRNLSRIMKGAELDTRRFNMSLLSVMFAGMALKSSMERLLRPAIENAGIFELWGDTLGTVFSPIMESLVPIFESISEMADRMPLGFKLALGVIALFLLVLGFTFVMVGQLGLAIGGLSVLLGKLTISATTASGAILTLGTSTTIAGTAGQAALAPFLPIMYAILAVVGLAVLLFYRWDDVSSSVENTFDKIGLKVRIMATSVVIFFGWMADRFNDFFKLFKEDKTLGNWLIEKWSDLKDWLSEKWNSIKESFINIWSKLKTWFFNLWDNISSWFSEKLNKIRTSFKEKWNALKIWFLKVLNNISSFFKEKWGSLKDWFLKKLESIFNIFKNIWNNLRDWFFEKLNKIKDLFSNVWTNIKDKASNIWGGIKNVIKGAINIILGWINKLTNAWNSLSFKVPSVKVGRFSFGGYDVGVPQIPKIPLLAKGGIVKRPTIAMVGESGPEAIVPLNKSLGNVINFSPTFNITVSDKFEFERMIKFNNTRMVEDLRRLVQN